MATDENWFDVCSVNDLQPDSGICALIEGRQVAIFYMPKEDKVYALDNYDPIGKAYVLSRGLIGDINEIPMVSSPLYKQHYSLLTGECMEDQSVKIDCFPVRIDQSRVEIGIEGLS